MSLIVKQHASITDFEQAVWDSLANDAGPFLSYHFLEALELSGSINNSIVNDTGWQPNYLAVYDTTSTLVAAVPGYIKTHSYGEYVFDHAWANAYAQHGLDYYPKWIGAIPFTPVTGKRILAKQDKLASCLSAIDTHLKNRNDVSSYHWLFTTQEQQKSLLTLSGLPRYSVQFQWQNRKFTSFEHYLSTFKSRKRKTINKERLKAQRGLKIQRLTGDAITREIQKEFYLCYQQTYLKRSGHAGYLTESFFERIFTQMKEQILLVVASDQSGFKGSALFFYDHTGLFGRYWGSLDDIDGLHFECCYYQGIEFAIENSLPIFNPGTQGEHKLLRGFEPWVCASCHVLSDQRFHSAISDFLERECVAIEHYYQSAINTLPFNSDMLADIANQNRLINTHKIKW
ncbi:N-acetyltransferase [Alteromonas sp. 5E99-2]|uniref:GNAT family N-acetyltransferase n=1 Tax=Alteromonas sp. 5E99-2 TaxID=2817683 RepID=UPI001A9973E8|nr:peptidogalycan biosysnthesis protein [Alteromonas sp. 5E99-2]MBO1255198.1 N-acetyltransferase [Alteromonas sp. 5E99-2]